MSLVSVPCEGAQTKRRRDFYLSNKLPHAVDLTCHALALSTTGEPVSEDDLPNSAGYDD